MAHFHNGAPVGEHWELHTPVEASVGLSGPKIRQAQTGSSAWAASFELIPPLGQQAAHRGRGAADGGQFRKVAAAAPPDGL